MIKVDPKKYNLSSRLNLEKDSENNYYIVVNRKSRIIMKDGIKIKNQATQIKSFEPNAKVKLKTTTSICSKTKHFLFNEDIEIVF
jgi:hypothetical protein